MDAAEGPHRRSHPLTKAAIEALGLGWTLAVITKLFVFDFDVYLVRALWPDGEWLLNYKVLAYFGLFCVALLFARSWRAKRRVAYIIAYPVAGPIRFIGALAWRHWPVLLAFAPVLVATFLGFRRTMIWYFVAAVAVAIEVGSKSTWLIWTAVGALAVFLVKHLLARIKNSFKESAFREWAQLVHMSRDAAIRNLFEDVKLPATEVSNKPELLNSAYVVHSFVRGVHSRVRDAATSRRFAVYLCLSWLYTYVLTVVIYALMYWGVFLVSPADFSNATDVGFWRFFQLSLGVFTSGAANVQPVGTFASILSSSEQLLIPVIGVIFVASLLTFAREGYQQGIDEFAAALAEWAANVEQRIQERYQITFVEVEVRLEQRDSSLVKFCRKFRGHPKVT